MSDVEQANTDNTAAAAENAPKEPSITELMGMIEELKKVQSGSDRKVKELSSALTLSEQEKEELQKERMSEKERSAFELKQQQAQIEAGKMALQQERLEIDRLKIITDLSVPKELQPLVIGKDKDEIMSNTTNMMKYIETAIQAGVQKKLVESGTKPPAGGDKETPGDLASWLKQISAMKDGPEREAAYEKAAAFGLQASG